MKLLTYEAGELVIRTLKGELVWSIDINNINGSFKDEYNGCGNKIVAIDGSLYIANVTDYNEVEEIEL